MPQEALIHVNLEPAPVQLVMATIAHTPLGNGRPLCPPTVQLSYRAIHVPLSHPAVRRAQHSLAATVAVSQRSEIYSLVLD